MPSDVIQCTHLANAEKTENDLTSYVHVIPRLSDCMYISSLAYIFLVFLSCTISQNKL